MASTGYVHARGGLAMIATTGKEKIGQCAPKFT